MHSLAGRVRFTWHFPRLVQDASWQASGATHSTVDAGRHTPARHASPNVQSSPSSQAVPSGAFGAEHIPVAGLQTPAPWH
jgi:hypothetical protein